MRGKLAKKIRKALGYKKTPDQLVDRGGIREKDGELVFGFARNPEANRYRWWKHGVTQKKLAPELIDYLAHQQELRLQTDQDDQHSEEECD